MKIFKIIQNIFFALLLVIVFVLLAVQFNITGNLKLYIVKSGSMTPAIRTGSLVAVFPKDNYQIDDIITFGSIGENAVPTTHRIVEVLEKDNTVSYQTKGDANRTEDNFQVKPSEVIGEVRLAVPYFGYIIDTARQPWGFFLIVVLPALLIIVEEAGGILKEIKKIRNKRDGQKSA